MGGTKRKTKKPNIFIRIFRVRNWKLIIICVLLGFLAATALRFDHIQMNAIKDEVLTADAQDNDELIVEKLNELKNFTQTHIIVNIIDENGAQKINFGTNPLYLENTYNRKAKAAIEEAQKQINSNTTNPNGNIYKEVANYCDALSRRYGWGFNQNYINCWTNKLAEYPSIGEIGAEGMAQIPSTELFRHDFASPIWYPCLSGWLILAVILLAIIIVIRTIIWLCMHIMLFILDHKKK